MKRELRSAGKHELEEVTLEGGRVSEEYVCADPNGDD